jgi:hypothetical protein
MIQIASQMCQYVYHISMCNNMPVTQSKKTRCSTWHFIMVLFLWVLHQENRDLFYYETGSSLVQCNLIRVKWHFYLTYFVKVKVNVLCTTTTCLFFFFTPSLLALSLSPCPYHCSAWQYIVCIYRWNVSIVFMMFFTFSYPFPPPCSSLRQTHWCHP